MWRFLTPVVEAAVLSGRLPRPVVNAAFAAAVSAVRVIGFISSSAASAAWLEFGNILEAIRHFATSRFDTVSLAVHDEGLAALGGAEKAGRSLSFGEPTFEALWALEGLGYRNAKLALKAKSNRPLDLGMAMRLPARHRGIFHVGSTIALAQDCLRRTARNSPADPADALASYLRICGEQVPKTLRGIEAESLGFVSATLFPEVLERAADIVSAHHRPLSAFFWHGVGRGLYLKYPPALGGPGRSWPALCSTLNASLDAEDEANTLAGYGWALGLVNLRHPSVICGRVSAFRSSGRDTEQLLRGLGEAFLCWLHWKGWDEKPEGIRKFAAVEGRLRGKQAGRGQQSEAWSNLVTASLDRLPETSPADLPFGRTYGEMLGPRADNPRDQEGSPQPRLARDSPGGVK